MTGDYRDAIPADIRREVLVEAGHRCAIPTCKYPRVQLHHIIPWSRVRRHDAENLIALCSNCHDRADTGEIDRKSVQMYKLQLQAPLVREEPVTDAGRNANGEYAYSETGALQCANVVEVCDVTTVIFPAQFQRTPDLRIYPEGVARVIALTGTGFSVELIDESAGPLPIRYVAFKR